MQNKINIIGAGLAGTECAWILSKFGIKSNLYEMKPNKKSEAHHSNNFAELVCSNSLKAEGLTNACGLLKEEMRLLGSIFVEAAYNSRVPAGQALAVDRDKFSEYITEKIKQDENITVIEEEVEDISKLEGTVVIATGPLTSEKLSQNISKLIGKESLYFYDAAAPIITRECIDMNIAYEKNRYKDEEKGDYLNLPFTKEEYDIFYNELINAKLATKHSFDTLEFFEGCMPIEEMARRGEKTLLFGPMKPVGLRRDETHRPHAVIQLRAENEEKSIYNIVGFQTSLSFPEQKRVFSLIPGLKDIDIVRYGVMHRNTYINGPEVLDNTFKMKNIGDKDIYFVGQISGVEGYVESAASGLMVAYNIINKMKNVTEKGIFPDVTMLGCLAKHISTENVDFQPMNANFGIIKPLEEKIKDKRQRYEKYSIRSLEKVGKIADEFNRVR